MKNNSVPTFDAMMNPLIEAMQLLGGSGTNEEIENKVAELLGLSDAQIDIPHGDESDGRTEFGYRLAWTRTYLKRFELIENSSRGVWALTPKGKSIGKFDEKEVVKFSRSLFKTRKENDVDEFEPSDSELTWREEMHKILLEISPDAFERLIQRILRESGFIQVEVTGRSGDGGIDGIGIIRLGGVLSFHVIFQCKRWKNSVPPTQIRDFRGAMVGRADKGLFITTSTFTREAEREATRDGAPAIDLINGEQLIDKLKELSLGIQTEIKQVENVIVDKEWFKGL